GPGAAAQQQPVFERFDLGPITGRTTPDRRAGGSCGAGHGNSPNGECQELHPRLVHTPRAAASVTSGSSAATLLRAALPAVTTPGAVHLRLRLAVPSSAGAWAGSAWSRAVTAARAESVPSSPVPSIPSRWATAPTSHPGRRFGLLPGRC